MVTLIAGLPGVGKSFLAVDIAARCSAALPWPDERRPAERAERPVDGAAPNSRTSPKERPGEKVLIVSAEDHPADTFANRVAVADGDLDKVAILGSICTSPSLDKDDTDFPDDRRFSLDRDLHHLRELPHRWGPLALIIVDPLISLCDGDDTERYLRHMLAELVRLAAYWDLAVIVIAHLRRDPATTDMYRALGSHALATVPRAIWTVQVDPRDRDRDRRLMLPLKTNMGPNPGGLAFRFVNARLEWDSEIIRRWASDPSETEEDASSALEEAIDFLTQMLADDEYPAMEIYSRARKCGFSQRTIERAKWRLKLKARRKGFGAAGEWFWSLATTVRPGVIPQTTTES
jgi:hypothetical protein